MNSDVDIYFSDRISCRVDDLPANALRDIIAALTIPNQEKIAAQKHDIWGWQQMPDFLELFDVRDGWISMPRGFGRDLVDGLRHYGYEPHFRDHQIWNNMGPGGNYPEPRVWQEKAVRAISTYQDGIYKAPAGSGKTVTILKAIQINQCNALVIVNTKDILWQWMRRIGDHLGEDYLPVGQVGDGIIDYEGRRITIATAQTIHSRFDALEQEGFFDAFSFVCLDECHHATAETFRRLVDRFSARFRVGVSATPDKTGDFRLAELTLGPVFHETKPEECSNLLKPQVFKIPTKFGFGFRSHVNRFQRSNYQQMIDALIRNPERNQLIVDRVMANRGHHQLVVTKRIEHIEILMNMLSEAGFEEGQDFMVSLKGDDSNDHRESVIEAISQVPGCVISTLADEALDIPRLDRLHLAFPQKNPGLVTQQVGRVERKHPDKSDAFIFDYADTNVGPLEAQWRTRRFEVYEPRGYVILNGKVPRTGP